MSLEDLFYDIDDNQESLENLNILSYHNQNTQGEDNSTIPRSTNEYIDLLNELNKTKYLKQKNVKDIKPFFDDDVNYNENSDVDINSSISSNSNNYSDDENDDNFRGSQAYFEKEAQLLENQNLNYIYYTSHMDGDNEKTNDNNKNNFKQKMNQMTNQSYLEHNVQNDQMMSMNKNESNSRYRDSHFIKKLKNKKKHLKKQLKEKHSLWTKKYNTVYMKENKKGFTEDFYSSSDSSLDSEDFESAKESVESLKYMDDLSIDELKNPTTVNVDSLEKNKGEEQQEVPTNDTLEEEEYQDVNEKDNEEENRKNSIESNTTQNSDQNYTRAIKVDKDFLNIEGDISLRSRCQSNNECYKSKQEIVLIKNEKKLIKSVSTSFLNKDDLDHHHENTLNNKNNITKGPINQLYNLHKDVSSKESLNSLESTNASTTISKNKLDNVKSYELKKSSSEFFDTKKKKKWTNFFSSKDKLSNSSSQIFLTEAEKQKLNSIKMSPDLKEKQPDIYNSMDSHQTDILLEEYNNDDVTKSGETFNNAFENIIEELKDKENIDYSDSSSNIASSITTNTTQKSTSLLKKLKLGNLKKKNNNSISIPPGATIPLNDTDSIITTDSNPTKKHSKDRESISSMDGLNLSQSELPNINTNDNSSHQYIKVHSKNKLQKEFTQLKLIQEFDNGNYPENKDEPLSASVMEDLNNTTVSSFNSFASTSTTTTSTTATTTTTSSTTQTKARRGSFVASAKQRLRKPTSNQFNPTATITSNNSTSTCEEKINRGPIWALAFSFDGQYLASGGQDGSLRVWRLLNSKSSQEPSPAPYSPIHNFSDMIKKDNNIIEEEPAQEYKSSFDPMNSPKMDNKEGNDSPKSQIHFETKLPDNSEPKTPGDNTDTLDVSLKANPIAASKTSICTVNTVQSATSNNNNNNNNNNNYSPIFESKPYRVYTGHTSDILDIAWSKNNYIITSSIDKTVRLWHISQMTCLCLFQHQDFVTSIKFHPIDDRYILTGCMDSKLRLWSIAEKKLVFWNEVSEKQMITAVGFTRDGSMAMAGTYIGNVLFYELEGLKYNTQITVKSNHSKGTKGKKITGIESFPRVSSGDDKILITSNDSRIRMYQLLDKSLYRKYKGHTNRNCQIKATFSEDGRYLICGSEDKQVYIWNTNIYQNQSNSFEFFLASDDIVTATVFAPRRTRVLLECEGLRNSKISTIDSNVLKKVKNQNSKKARIVENVTTTLANGNDKRPGSLNSASGMIFAVADVKGRIRIFENEIVSNNETSDGNSKHSKENSVKTIQ